MRAPPRNARYEIPHLIFILAYLAKMFRRIDSLDFAPAPPNSKQKNYKTNDVTGIFVGLPIPHCESARLKSA